MRGHLAALLAAGVLATQLATTEARVNATGAIAVFLISDCATCTADKNSAFCSEAGSDSNFAQNTTFKVTIAQKKTDVKWGALGPVDGAKFCWEGTFGSIKNNHVSHVDMLADTNVTASLDCAGDKTYYRNCFIPAQTAIILMVVGGLAFSGGIFLILLCCGCCKCCNEKGDDSKYGMCNRYCPWCYICADKHLRVEERKVEISEERSLTGKNQKLNHAYGKTLSDKEEGVVVGRNPMASV